MPIGLPSHPELEQLLGRRVDVLLAGGLTPRDGHILREAQGAVSRRDDERTRDIIERSGRETATCSRARNRTRNSSARVRLWSCHDLMDT
jgi:hypothetical protein